MRIRVRLENPHGATVPFNYQQHLAAAVYGMLEVSDADYARFLHDEGYGAEGDAKRFKMFVFSWLRGRRVASSEGGVRFERGAIDWFVASPVDDFMQHFVSGLLANGTLQLGPATFKIQSVEPVPTPMLSAVQRFSSLSPIVAAVRDPRGARYLRAEDGEEFSEAVRRNLVRKYTLLNGSPPADDTFSLTFDPDYVARNPHGASKKMTVYGIDVVGVLAPFTVLGSSELMKVGLSCGMGEKNPAGFGMVEARN